MPALRQKLLLYLSAFAAFLTCVSWINIYNSNTSFCGFVFENFDELTPSYIHDATSHPVVLGEVINHQAFHGDKPITTNQIQSCLMRVIPASIGYFCTNLGCDMVEFISVFSATFFSTERSLSAADFIYTIFEKTRIIDTNSITGTNKRFYSEINSNSWHLTFRNNFVSNIASKYRKPHHPLSFQGNIFYYAVHLTMKFTSNRAYVLDSQITSNSNPIIVCKFNSLKTFYTFKSRVSRFSSSLNPSVKIDKRPMKPTHRALSTRKIKSIKPWVRVTFVGKPRRLIEIIQSKLIRCVCRIAHFQTSVIKPAMSLKHNAEFAGLIGIGIQSEFVNRKHARFSVL